MCVRAVECSSTTRRMKFSRIRKLANREIINKIQLIGYVPQEDVMIRELTVRENILHSANVRLPGSWSDLKRRDHADAVIETLG